jgi:hypothetical protein
MSFLLAAVATLPLPAHPPASGHKQGLALAEVVEGFRTVRRVGWVGGTILLLSVTNIGIIGAERLALPGAAADRYGQLGGYSTIVIAIAAGGILAAWITGRSPMARAPGVATYRAALLLGAATLSLGLARGIAAAALLGLAFGVGQQRAQLLWITSLQRNTPDRLLGRISAIDDFGSFLFLPVSFAVGGLVVQAVSPEVVLLAAGAACMLTATIGLTVPGLHRWRPFTDPSPPVQVANASLAGGQDS